MKINTKDLTLISLFCAIICIFSIISIPIGPVPISICVLAIFLSSIVLGFKKSIITVIVYILIGSLGLPVFSGFRGGVQVLFGPTGGYIFSYIFIAGIMGLASDNLSKIKHKKMFLFSTSLLSLFICYITGSVQYMLIYSIEFKKALISSAFIFLPFDILKSVLAIIIGTRIK
ncbi:MAG: biotin transporter BioY [Clostridia bacterium]|nr:biotin transporter BioY [Clostridia bacterium]